MTHEEKINYMKIASGMVGYAFNLKDLDMLVSIYELLTQKKGSTDLRAVLRVESDVKERADIKSRSELLDTVAAKVR